MQLSSAELIVTIVFAIVGLLMGFVSGAMPLQPQRIDAYAGDRAEGARLRHRRDRRRARPGLMNVAMWTTLIAVALGIAVANIPVIRRTVTKQIAWFAPKPDDRRSKRRRC